MKKMKRISFDFDNTLQNPDLKTLAKGFIEDGHEVFIVTSRFPNLDNSDLFAVAKEVGIPVDNVVFSHVGSKILGITSYRIDVHFEDCPVECAQLRPFCNVIQVEPFIIEEE